MNNRARTIYLASPYGFSEQWKRLLLPEFIGALEALGLEVWEPFARNGQVNLGNRDGPIASRSGICRMCVTPMRFSPS